MCLFAGNHFTLTLFIWWQVYRLSSPTDLDLNFTFFTQKLWDLEQIAWSLWTSACSSTKCVNVHCGLAVQLFLQIPAHRSPSPVAFADRPMPKHDPAPGHTKHVTRCLLYDGCWVHTSSFILTKPTKGGAGTLEPARLVLCFAGFMKSVYTRPNVDIHIFEYERVLHLHGRWEKCGPPKLKKHANQQK